MEDLKQIFNQNLMTVIIERGASMKKSNIKTIDFHSHILPGADHGSDGVETSLAQLELMVKAGVDIVVSTTHFYPHRDTVEAFLSRRAKAAELLANAKSDDIRVALGAEVYAVAGLEKLDGLEKLTIKGTNTMLLEMPTGYWNSNVIDTALALDSRFDVILAHIDRYSSSEVNKLLEMGLRAQVNAGNILKNPNKKRVKDWLDEGAVWALGSDIHNVDEKAVKSFQKAQKLMKHDIEEIFSRTEKLISGAELM